MKVFCSGTARIKNRETGVIHQIRSEELDWDEQGIGEGPMGAESEHKAVLEHPDLGTLTWLLCEYPVGVQDDQKTDVGGHELIKDFDYYLAHEPEPPDSF